MRIFSSNHHSVPGWERLIYCHVVTAHQVQPMALSLLDTWHLPTFSCVVLPSSHCFSDQSWSLCCLLIAVTNATLLWTWFPLEFYNRQGKWDCMFQQVYLWLAAHLTYRALVQTLSETSLNNPRRHPNAQKTSPVGIILKFSPLLFYAFLSPSFLSFSNFQRDTEIFSEICVTLRKRLFWVRVLGLWQSGQLMPYAGV